MATTTPWRPSWRPATGIARPPTKGSSSCAWPPRAVTGSSLYLLAQEVLQDPAPAVRSADRQAALRRLRRVQTLYRDHPTTLLGGGPNRRLGVAAAALLFREERLSAGAILPPMAGRDLDGRAVTNATWAGRYTLVDFWATWCPPCVAAFPKLRDLSKRYGTHLRVVPISADATQQAARTFAKREGAGWDQWYAGPSGAASPAWSNASCPYFLLVGPDWRILRSGQDVPLIEAAAHRSCSPSARALSRRQAKVPTRRRGASVEIAHHPTRSGQATAFRCQVPQRVGEV
jgi:thiol-disulfide isomerase/thioredoxin